MSAACLFAHIGSHGQRRPHHEASDHRNKRADNLDEGDDVLVPLSPGGPIGVATVQSIEKPRNEQVGHIQVEIRITLGRVAVLDAEAVVVVLI